MTDRPADALAAAAWIALAMPFVGALLTPLAARLGAAARSTTAVGASFVAAAAALSLLPALLQPERLPVESTAAWIDAPVRIGFGLLIDPLAIVLANVVAVISFLIMIYCAGYMRGDPGATRFWIWMNGFIGSMLLLVLADNLLWLFVGWKLVGLCSYGLIGYYYRDQREYWIGGPAPAPFVTPSAASLKALVTTGAGDMLMLGGILLLYAHSGTLNFVELYATAPIWLPSLAASPGLLTLVILLLLAGPAGKSAQFPFHEWLPEAMAGPGPVSALIHAATMVKSGVYLVARLVPIFWVGLHVSGIDGAALFFQAVAWIGAFTALLAATQAMVALELKKVLAYSTVSQIGYMMVGLGAAGLAPGLLVEGYTAGLFHLVSHALFKACLFLCAGTVIHAVHSIYVTDMGGMRRYLPLTWGFILVAALSLMGMPPLPGFWSKDAVLVVAYRASTPLFGLGLLTAGLTAFYTVRMVALVFHGPESAHVAAARGHGGGHLDDGARSMRFASGVLALLIVAAGVGAPVVEQVLHHGFDVSLDAQVAGGVAGAADQPQTGGASDPHLLVMALSLIAIAGGAGAAAWIYLLRKRSPDAILAANGVVAALHHFFWNRWGIDGAYQRIAVGGAVRIADVVAERIEAPWDRAVHVWLPRLVLERLHGKLIGLRADSETLADNISYVLVLFALLLAAVLFWSGGGGG